MYHIRYNALRLRRYNTILKLCTKCKREKEANLDNFYPRKDSKDGLSYWCRECILNNAKNYRENNKDKHNQSSRTYYENNKQKKAEYDKLYYQQNKNKKLNYEHQKYINTDKNKIRNYHRDYNEKNKDKIIIKNKEYRINNINKLRNYDKERYKKNKLSRLVSNAIGRSLKGAKNEQHWESIVNYTLQELKEHIEKQFDENMSWSNYGTYWEIDHIVPQNQFNIVNADCHDFKICWSLANLRPLEKSLNRRRPKDGSDIADDIKNNILNQSI